MKKISLIDFVLGMCPRINRKLRAYTILQDTPNYIRIGAGQIATMLVINLIILFSPNMVLLIGGD